jgi:predicted ATPase
VFDLIASLIDNSLLRQEAGAGSEPRFLMLETVREFGIERLGEARDEVETRRRHAAYYLALVERWSPDPVLPGEKRRLAAIAADYDNVRLALAWFDEQDDAGGLLRLTGALFEYWFARGLYTQGRQWMRRALGRGETGDPSVRVRALTTAGALARFPGRCSRAMLVRRRRLSRGRCPWHASSAMRAN